MEEVVINITDIVEGVSIVVTEGVSDSVVISVSDIEGNTSLTVDDTLETVIIEITDISQALKGDSAYQVAVDNGYEGTEVQWLASLKGVDSTVQGPQGERGLQGIQGVAGNDSIIPGPQGVQGVQGIPGQIGTIDYSLVLAYSIAL
jgi:hypothetical protein